MSGKRKAAREAAAASRRAADLANRRYEDARSGRMPSMVAKQTKEALSTMGTQMRGAAMGSRSGFQRALSRRQAKQGMASAMPRTLGSLASARAQEQLGLMGAAQGHQFGMIANQAQYLMSAHNNDLIKAGIGAAGSALSSFI